MAKVTATATHWATRGDNGELTLVAVTAMTTPHLIRCVRLFRKKALDHWVGDHPDADPDEWPPNGVIDMALRATMPSMPAIYNELRQRSIDLFEWPDLNLDAALAQSQATQTTTWQISPQSSTTSNVVITYLPPQHQVPLGGLTGTESEKARKRRRRREMKHAKAVEKTLAKLQVRPVGRRRIRVD
jgi:hypothetical protein